jgi:hypothetical protein
MRLAKTAQSTDSRVYSLIQCVLIALACFLRETTHTQTFNISRNTIFAKHHLLYSGDRFAYQQNIVTNDFAALSVDVVTTDYKTNEGEYNSPINKSI